MLRIAFEGDMVKEAQLSFGEFEGEAAAWGADEDLLCVPSRLPHSLPHGPSPPLDFGESCGPTCVGGCW